MSDLILQQGNSYKEVNDHCLPAILPTLSSFKQDQGITDKKENKIYDKFQNVPSSAS